MKTVKPNYFIGIKTPWTLENETVWLTQEQISTLFQRERSVITKHIGNVFKEGELNEKSNVQILHISTSDRAVKFYQFEETASINSLQKIIYAL